MVAFRSVKEEGLKLDIFPLMRTNVGTAVALCVATRAERRRRKTE